MRATLSQVERAPSSQNVEWDLPDDCDLVKDRKGRFLYAYFRTGSTQWHRPVDEDGNEVDGRSSCLGIDHWLDRLGLWIDAVSQGPPPSRL